MVIAKQIFGIHLGHENTHDLSYLVRYIRKLTARLKNVNPDNIVFTDEKLWSIEEKHNTQNSRVYAKSRDMIPEQYKRVEKSLHPKTVMVWAGISGKGKTQIVFLPEGAKNETFDMLLLNLNFVAELMDHPVYIRMYRCIRSGKVVEDN